MKVKHFLSIWDTQKIIKPFLLLLYYKNNNDDDVDDNDDEVVNEDGDGNVSGCDDKDEDDFIIVHMVKWDTS